MNIEYLDEFVKVSKYLNFRETAALCHISQPVLTRHILKLEAEFGVKLLDRNTQSVALTDAGRAFLASAIPILEKYEELKTEMRSIKKGYERYLRIGVPYYGAENYLGEIPQLFEERYPSINLEYKVGGLNEVLRFLYEGKVDVSVAPNFCYPESGRLQFFEMFHERLGVLVSTSDPLAARTKCSLAELKDKVFFSVENDYSNNSWELTRELCHNMGFVPKGPVLFNSSETAIMAIRRNEGVFVVGDHMRIHESPKLAFLDLTDEICRRRVGLWCVKGNKSEDVLSFIKLAIHSYPESGD